MDGWTIGVSSAASRCLPLTLTHRTWVRVRFVFPSSVLLSHTTRRLFSPSDSCNVLFPLYASLTHRKAYCSLSPSSHSVSSLARLLSSLPSSSVRVTSVTESLPEVTSVANYARSDAYKVFSSSLKPHRHPRWPLFTIPSSRSSLGATLKGRITSSRPFHTVTDIEHRSTHTMSKAY